MRRSDFRRKSNAIAIVAFAVLFSTTAPNSQAADVRKAKLLLRAQISESSPPYAGTIAVIDADGGMKINALKADILNRGVPSNLPAEGLYLGVVRGALKSLDDAKLFRVQVTEVSRDGDVIAKVAPGASKQIETGRPILLVRPPKASSAEMKALPDFLRIDKGPLPEFVQAESKADAANANSERSAQNLAEIAQGLLSFEGAYGQLPPAMLIGPDGKPWHSWRVLIWGFLPGANNEGTFRKYRFDEPWDGPNNQKLLAAMPAVYSDKAPDQNKNMLTSYAAVTGSASVFSAEGFKFDGKSKSLRKGAGVRLNQIIDGTSNTLAIGTLSPEKEIPWMKPEDVVVTDKPMHFGADGGFGAPYKSKMGRFGLFLATSGQVHGIYDNIDESDFQSMLTMNDRKPLDLQKVPTTFIPNGATAAAVEPSVKSPTIYIFDDGGVVKARLARQ